MVLERRCKERATDRSSQQVKQHGLSFLYREVSSPHIASPPWPLPPSQLVNNTDAHNATAALAHALCDTCPLSKDKTHKRHMHLQVDACIHTHTPDTQVQTSPFVHHKREETDIWNFFPLPVRQVSKESKED